MKNSKKRLAIAALVYTACSIAALSSGAEAALLTVETAQKAIAKPLTLRDRSLDHYAQFQKPGAFDQRPASDFVDNFSNDAGDALFFAPGVQVNALDINEPRLSIRGFGAANRLERSTALVLRDGAPLTDVHGTTNVQEIDLLAVNRVDVYRGGGGDLRVSGSNLGGVFDFVSATGLTTRHKRQARLDAGAAINGAPGGRVHADLSGVSGSGNFDFYAGVTGNYETGFRDQNQRDNAILNANIGYRPSQSFKTRFFLELVRSNQELAGGVLLADALDDPEQAASAITLGPLFPGGPIVEFAGGAEDSDFSRDLLTGRIANQTDFRLFGLDVESGFHFTRRENDTAQIDFSGIVEESGNEWGARLALGRSFQLFTIDTSMRLGGDFSRGSQSSDRFENIAGVRGDQFVDTEQQSTNISGFFETVLKPFQRLLVTIGAKFIHVERELTVDDNNNSQQRDFTGIAAQGGIVYRFSDNVQFFANAARTFEPPSFSELISGNPEDLNSLDEQDAITFEAGVRGALSDRIGWDVTYFRTNAENEIINIDEPETNGIGSTLVNIDETQRQGVELGLDINLFPAASQRALTLRSVYGYNDFSFRDADPLPVSDTNRLAGVPTHVYRGELRYDADGPWFAAVNVALAGGDFFADHENIVSVPTYTTVGFSAGWRFNDQIELFASGENITNLDYIGGVTPVTSQTLQNARLFTPAARASVYGGVRYRF